MELAAVTGLLCESGFTINREVHGILGKGEVDRGEYRIVVGWSKV